MADKDYAAHKIRSRIDSIDYELRQARNFLEYGATYDYEYRMTDAQIDSLRIEKNKLKEILGDL